MAASVAVLGAGTMGSGIAQVAAAAGHPVILADPFAGAVERARTGHAKTMAREVEKGRLTAAAAEQLVGRISYLTPAAGDLSALAGADLVIEAILEDLPIKQATFKTVMGPWKFKDQVIEQFWTVGQWQNGVFYGVASTGSPGAKPVVLKTGW